MATLGHVPAVPRFAAPSEGVLFFSHPLARFIAVAMKRGNAIHIKVRDLEESAAFYTHFLGLQVTERVGNTYVFLTAGSTHHDVALQRISGNAPLPASHSVGLYHTAFEVLDKCAFAETYCTLTRAGVPVVMTDHRISWAMYFSDPSSNGVEVYCDTRREPDGTTVWKGADRPLDERKILGALERPA